MTTLRESAESLLKDIEAQLTLIEQAQLHEKTNLEYDLRLQKKRETIDQQLEQVRLKQIDIDEQKLALVRTREQVALKERLLTEKEATIQAQEEKLAAHKKALQKLLTEFETNQKQAKELEEKVKDIEYRERLLEKEKVILRERDERATIKEAQLEARGQQLQRAIMR